MSYSLIIPIYNEENILPKLIKKLESLENKLEIILVDDGSSDSSYDIISKCNSFNILQNSSNQGKGSAVKKGVNYARNQNIIIMDGDLELEINIIPELINSFEKLDIEVLCGIRWTKKDPINLEINRFGNYFINNFFNFLYNASMSDVLCCARVMKKNLFKSLEIESNGFSLEVETAAKIISKQIKYGELLIGYKRRSIKEGKKLKFSDSFQIFYTILKYKIKKF